MSSLVFVLRRKRIAAQLAAMYHNDTWLFAENIPQVVDFVTVVITKFIPRPSIMASRNRGAIVALETLQARRAIRVLVAVAMTLLALALRGASLNPISHKRWQRFFIAVVPSSFIPDPPLRHPGTGVRSLRWKHFKPVAQSESLSQSPWQA